MAILPHYLIQVEKSGTTYDLPTPKSFSIDYQDFDSDASTRSTDGTMVRDRITIKRKLNMEWGPMTPGEMSTLLNAVYTTDAEYKANTKDSVAIPDPNVWVTLTPTEQQEWKDRVFANTGKQVPNDYDTYTEDQVTNLRNDIDKGLQLTNSARNERIFFYCRFPEVPVGDSPGYGQFYVGDRNSALLWSIYDEKTGRHETMYNGLTMNFIER